LVGKPERKRPLGRPRHRWDDNIRRDLMEIGWEVVYWNHLSQDKDRWWVLMNSLRKEVSLDSVLSDPSSK
jgi:hypothetical protein